MKFKKWIIGKPAERDVEQPRSAGYPFLLSTVLASRGITVLRYAEKILAGEAEGVVPHTNTMADMDFESYDAYLEWMAEHGDEEI